MWTEIGELSGTKIGQFSVITQCDKIFDITVKGLKPASSCVIDQDATTALVRHM